MRTNITRLARPFNLLMGICLAGSIYAQTFNVARVFTVVNPSKVCATEEILYEIPNLTVSAVEPDDFGSNGQLHFNWIFDDGSCVGPSPCNTGSTVRVKWDNTCNDGFVDCLVTLTYTDTNNQPASANISVNQHNVFIHNMPGPITLNGPDEIECQTQTQVTYSTSACAIDFFNWTVPSGWTIVSGQNTNSLSTIPSATSGGTVSVQAQNACNGQAQTASKPVTRICPDNKHFTSATSSLPEHTAVKFDITSNTSSGFIRVTSSQAVRFKAGESITIEPHFEAEQGSFFQAKIGPCVDCFAFKRLDEVQASTQDTSFSAYVICPNPSDGLFTIGCNSSGSEKPGTVTVRIFDLHARLVMERQFTNSASFEVDLRQEPAGLYIVELHHSGEAFVQKVQKF